MNFIRTLEKGQLVTHNIKQLGFSGLWVFGSRSNFFQRWIKTQPVNPTVSYCQTLSASIQPIPNIETVEK